MYQFINVTIYQFINLSIIFLFSVNYSISQNKTDSLENILKLKPESDNTEVCIKLAEEFRKSDSQKSLKFAKTAFDLSLKYKNKKNEAKALNEIGITYKIQSDYKTAIEYYEKSLLIKEKIKTENPTDTINLLEISKTLNNIGSAYNNLGENQKAIEFYKQSLEFKKACHDDKGVANTLFNIGNVYINQQNYESAIECYQQAQNIFEKINNESGIASCYNTTGLLYEKWGNYKKAFEYYEKLLKIQQKLNNKYAVAEAYNNLGNVTSHEKDYKKAEEYYRLALAIYQEVKSKLGIAKCLHNIGVVYTFQNDEKKALHYYFQALRICKEIDNKSQTIDVLSAIGKTLIFQKSFTKAIEYLNESNVIAQELQQNDALSENYFDISKAYQGIGNINKSFDYFKKAVALEDSIYNESSQKAITELQTKYETEKKELQIDNLNKENALKKAELSQSEEQRSKQLIIIWFVVVGLLLVVVFSIFMFRLFMQKKKANLLLAHQKKQIELKNSMLEHANQEISKQKDLVVCQKDHIEEQKKEIEDSIIYAQRIQQAVLPTLGFTESILGEHFIIFMPKDVVSGDFYWVNKVNEWLFIAVADCTGHGVPGAFMSMLGISFLNEIIKLNEIVSTGQVLDQLRLSIINALKQKGLQGEQKDGMDISIVAIKLKDPNSKLQVPNSKLQVSSLEKSEKVTEGESENEADNIQSAIDNNQSTIDNNLSLVGSPQSSIIGSQFAISTSNVKLQTSNFYNVQWSGANNPLYIIRNERIIELNNCEEPDTLIEEIKPDKMPVAIYDIMDNFRTNKFALEKGDRLYLFTDGFADQFGGPKGKKFKYKPFKNVLASNCNKSITVQYVLLENALLNWIKHINIETGNSYEQVDDITVIGIEI